MGYAFAADGQAPEATRYYSQMTETQEAEIRHEAILAIMDDARLAVRVIEPEEEAQRISRLMEEADERTREVLERYGALHPSRSATAATQVCASKVRTRLLHRLPIPGMPTGVL
jgi:NADH:ubiquinone oxidoreductase subunit E